MEIKEKIRKLTKREIEVLQCKAKGMFDKQIALQLGITYGTVRNHVDRIKLKLQCRNTFQLACILQEAGLISQKFGRIGKL